MIALLPLNKRGDLGACLFKRSAVDQLTEYPEVPASPLIPFFGGVGEWRPDLRAVRNREPRRRDADHDIRFTIDADGLSDHVWICSKLPLPELMAQNCAAMLAGCLFVPNEVASERQWHAERVKEVSRDAISGNLLRRVDARQVGIPPPGS